MKWGNMTIRVILMILLLTVGLVASGCSAGSYDPAMESATECDSHRYGGVSIFRTNMATVMLSDAAIYSVNGKPVKIGPPDERVYDEYNNYSMLNVQSYFDYCNAEFPEGEVELTVTPLKIVSDKDGNYSINYYDFSFPITVTLERGRTYFIESIAFSRGGEYRDVPYVTKIRKDLNGKNIVIASPATKLIGLSDRQVEAYAKAMGDPKVSLNELETMRLQMLKETGYLKAK